MKYTNPQQAVELAIEHITDWEKEHAVGIFIGPDTKIKQVELLAIGTQTNLLITPREYYRSAIRWASVVGVLLHNHPIDDLTPSAGDLAITQSLVRSGDIIQLPLLDHIIFNRKREYFSFKENKLIPKIKL